MKTTFLFSNSFKKIGWILFIPSFITGIFLMINQFEFGSRFMIKVYAIASNKIFSENKYFSIIENGFLDEIILLLIIIGAILVGFSKLQTEDEFTSKIRYESLVWATYFNYAIIILSTVFIYGINYLNFLLVNIFSLLIFFIIRFHFMLYKLNKSSKDEE